MRHPSQAGSSQSGWVILPTGLNPEWPCIVQGPKFKILIHRRFVSRSIEYTCKILSTYGQVISEPRGFENVDIATRKDGHIDI